MTATLQINFAPPDVQHAAEILPHQLRVWAGQVSEITFTLDTMRPAGGRFAAEWDEYNTAMMELLVKYTTLYPSARVSVVDTSDEAVRQVSRRFFARDRVPFKDSRGGPSAPTSTGCTTRTTISSCIWTRICCSAGGSQTWLQEAVEIYERPQTVFVGPLPGPPRADGALFDQPLAVPEPQAAHVFSFPAMSSRTFLVDRRRLAERVGPLPLEPPILLRSRLKAHLKGNPSVAMPEQLLSRALGRRGLLRVDFLGRPPGMWSLHPAYRNQTFYRELRTLVARVEAEDVPIAQRGHYDVVDELIDFSDVRAKLRRSPLRR